MWQARIQSPHGWRRVQGCCSEYDKNWILQHRDDWGRGDGRTGAMKGRRCSEEGRSHVQQYSHVLGGIQSPKTFKRHLPTLTPGLLDTFPHILHMQQPRGTLFLHSWFFRHVYTRGHLVQVRRSRVLILTHAAIRTLHSWPIVHDFTP